MASAPRELERFMAEMSERVCSEAARRGVPVDYFDLRAAGRYPGEDYTYRGAVDRYGYGPRYMSPLASPTSTPAVEKPKSKFLNQKLLLTKGV